MSENTLLLVRRVVVKEIVHETRSAVSLVLEPVGWDAVWRSGQFLTFIFQTRFGEKRRSYSISSSYELSEPLRITVKRIENGEFSRQMVDLAKPGDELLTTGVGGKFTLPEDPYDYEHYCFLAAGSGIAPVLPMIKDLLRKTSLHVTLLYSSSNLDACIFYRELTEIAASEPRFTLRFFISDRPRLAEGRLSKPLLSQVMEEWFTPADRTAFYLCGPFEYMQTARIVLLMHTRAEHIHTEHFEVFPRPELREPPDRIPHDVTIRIGTAEITLKVGFPDSVLQAAKKAGITLPYSCEAGRCASCVATVTGGKFWMAYNEVLTDKEVQNGRILTCQAYPVGGNGSIAY